MSPVHALVAVKELTRAKSRLGADFAPADRRRLVLAMLRDTVATANAVDDVASVTVVSPDAEILAAAHEAGADGVLEIPTPTLSADRRLNDALNFAAAHLRETRRAANLLALQADLPACTPFELESAIRAASRHARAFVVDHRGSGTSALFVRGSGTPFAPMFGSGSAVRHAASGAVALDGEWPGLRLDVDTRADLELATTLGIGPETCAALIEIGWGDSAGTNVHLRSERTRCAIPDN